MLRCSAASQIAVTAKADESRSRRRRRQALVVFRAILRLTELGWHDQQVIVHFWFGEGLAELGGELPLLEMARQDLELLEVVSRRLAYQVAAGTLLAVLVQPLANHLV